VYATNTPTLWFQGGMYASSTSYFDTINATGFITASQPGATPIIRAFAANGSDYVQMYSSGGFGQLEASNQFVLTAPSGVVVTGTANPQLRIQYAGGNFSSLEVFHNDTNAIFQNNATNGNYVFSTDLGGRVGIGSSTPRATLSIGGNATGTFWVGSATTTHSTTTDLAVLGQVFMSGMPTGCLQSTAGIITSTGSACGGAGSSQWTTLGSSIYWYHNSKCSVIDFNIDTKHQSYLHHQFFNRYHVEPVLCLQLIEYDASSNSKHWLRIYVIPRLRCAYFSRSKQTVL